MIVRLSSPFHRSWFKDTSRGVFRAFLLVFLLAGLNFVFIAHLSVSAHAKGAPVSAATLKNLRGVYVAIWKGHKAKVKIEPNGTLRAVSDNRFDEGRWTVKGNALCVSFKVWTKGRYKCGRVYRNGRWFEGLYKKDGTPRLRFRR
ncbi:hypothetical protein [Thermopetrobacter sp. TC1]|uniref:hypothetical protein n=1 Tax=Thermopetrobacter sp. TC1 TaxID=1495045 RepID=UPI00056FD6D2|nr:hypothetical protein [Thermopetrobacter sp. TC1]